jgi:hypothetical protein
MPMAIQEWPRLQALLQRQGISASVFRDPKVSAEEWQAAVRSTGWIYDPSTAAPVYGTPPEHFPALRLSSGKREHPLAVLGVMPSKAWSQVIAKRVADLRSLSAPPASPNACIPPLTYLPIQSPNPLAELGGYERVSPDGRFVLRSFSGAKIGQVALVELPEPGNTTLKLHETGLRNEAFPVQRTWRFLVDVDGTHYRFSDVLHQGARAKPLFRAGMTGFYASASEMPSKADRQIHIRSLSWPQPDGNTPSGGGDDAATGPLQVQTLRIEDDWPRSHSARVVQRSAQQFICTQRNASDGSVYALPMLSLEGLAFSAVPQMPKSAGAAQRLSMRTYSLAADPMAAQQPCTLLQDLGRAPSKAVFGPQPSDSSAPQWIAFTDNAQVHVADQRLTPAQSFPIPVGKFNVLASAFPGITADGRVVYAATWQDCEAASCAKQAGYVVADPYQMAEVQAAWKATNTPAKACITQAEVAEQRANFAAFHGLPLPAQRKSPP